MYKLIEPIRRLAIFLERYELYKILDKVALKHRRANPQIFTPSKYDIPSLIWPPPLTDFNTMSLDAVSEGVQ